MSFDELKNSMIGAWAGSNVLRLSWMTPQEHYSSGELVVAQIIKGKFLTFTYGWRHEEMPHEGLLLVGYDAKSKVANGAWIDSWHSSTKPLILSGSVDEPGIIDLRGTYEVPNHPDWGWRIVISAPAEALQIVMYNVSPEGEEDLAVRADYKKQSSG